MNIPIHIGSRVNTPSFHGLAAVSRRDITPPVGIRSCQWGPADWNAVEGVHKPLTLTAFAFGTEDGSKPALLFCVDGSFWQRVADEWSVRGAILRELELDESQVMFSLSHTHAGPGLSTSDQHLTGGEFVPVYLRRLAELAVEAGAEALANLEPARLEWGVGRSSLAAVRDVDVDGRTLVGLNPHAVADDSVMVGRLTTSTGQAMGTIVNYACHPTTLAWQNRLISPDYVGALREVVEAETQAPCAFLQGASGELAPAEQYTGDLAVADRHGSALGHAVLAALSSLPPAGTSLELSDVVESGAPLAMWQCTQAVGNRELHISQVEVEMTLQELPSLEQLETTWSGIDPLSREERLRRARNLREGYIDGPNVRHPLWIWQLGDAIFLGHPGEAYSQLQQTVRAQFPDNPVIVMNLTNGPGFVYLPSQEAYDRGTYSAWQTPLAPGSLEKLEQSAIAAINAISKAEPRAQTTPLLAR